MTGRLRLIGAAILIALAAVTAFLGQPTAADQIARNQQQLTADLAGRRFHIDPGELVELMYDPTVNLALIDVRPEGDYNQFHLVGARSVDAAALSRKFIRDYPDSAVKVIMSNDEQAATVAWEQLKAQGMLNVYILAGGVNFWLDVYGGPATPDGFVPANDDLTTAGHGEIDTARIMTPFNLAAVGDDSPRHRFKGADGEAYPAARPDREELPQRDFEKKVVIQQAGPKVSGGCG